MILSNKIINQGWFRGVYMKSLNIRFYIIFFFIFVIVAAVGYLMLFDDKDSRESIEFYYSELKSKDIRNNYGVTQCVFTMKVLYNENTPNEVEEDNLYEVVINPDYYKGYGVGSVLKSYFDEDGKLYLAGISLEEPYEGLKPHS